MHTKSNDLVVSPFFAKIGQPSEWEARLLLTNIFASKLFPWGQCCRASSADPRTGDAYRGLEELAVGFLALMCEL